VEFEDQVLVRLADASTRDSLFDDDSLAAIATAGYDHPELSGPYTAIFDTVDLVVAPPSTVVASCEVYPTPGAAPVPANLTVAFPVDAAAPRLTALWRGSVVARARPAADPVTLLDVRWPRLEEVDAAIVAATGGLPAAADALEEARRAQLRALLADAAGTAVLTGDAELERWLQLAGAPTVGALLPLLSSNGGGAYVRLGFADPAAVPASPRPLPVTVALLARDAGFSLGTLLTESAVLRTRLCDAEGGSAAPADLRRLADVIVGWIVPAATFNDASWPGGDAGTAAQRQAARRAAAATWLAGQGIALIAVSLS
jgi:hypothetical protein